MKRSERTFFGRVLHGKCREVSHSNHHTLHPGTRFLSTIFASLGIFIGIFAVSNIQTFAVSAASLELTLPSSFSLDLSAGNENGFGISDPAQLKVKTSAFFGYNLSIKATDGNTLKNGAHLLNPISKTYDSDDDYKNATDNNNEVDTWAFKPSKWQNADNTKLLPGPTDDTTIEKTTAANDVGNSYDVSLAAKINAATAAGQYTNTFVVTATANTTHYKITYDLNQGEGGPTNPQEDNTTESTIKLDDKAPTRTSYDFLGYCDAPTTDSNCTGHTYQPGDTYPYTGALKNNDNDVTLYSIWKSQVPTTMQDFGDYCSQMEEHQELTLKDIRDNNDYTIAKLKDGRCWMTQNLRIINTRVNNENSDIPSGNFDIPSSSRDFTRDYAAFYDSEYGGYYNYKVASANSPIMTGQIDRSICSKGWHIPSLSEWTTMLNFYNSYQALIQQPINLKFQTSMCGAQGTYCWVPQRHGYWWRSDSYDSTRAHTVYLMEGTGMNIPPYGSQNGKSCGFYIRCISD